MNVYINVTDSVGSGQDLHYELDKVRFLYLNDLLNLRKLKASRTHESQWRTKNPINCNL